MLFPASQLIHSMLAVEIDRSGGLQAARGQYEENDRCGPGRVRRGRMPLVEADEIRETAVNNVRGFESI